MKLKTEIQIQQENIAELLRLSQEHPDLRIVPMVDSEIVADDGFCWWVGSFGKAEVDEIWSNDERLYIRSADEDSLVDDLCDNILIDETDTKTDEEIESLAKSEVAAYEWEKVIAVKIALP